MAATGYQILEWRDFQHYKGRSPTWLKLHRTMLDNQRWRLLSPAGAKLLVDLWMVAAEGDRNGRIEHASAWLAWRLRLASRRLEPRLQELVTGGWIRELNGAASPPLADGYHREEQIEQIEGACEKCGKPLRVKGRRLVPCDCDTKRTR